MGKLKYLSGGQIKIYWYSGIKFCSETGLNIKYIPCRFFHVLPALEHHTYSEDDVEEGGIKIKQKIKFFS
jgi:hypothetical protein